MTPAAHPDGVDPLARALGAHLRAQARTGANAVERAAVAVWQAMSAGHVCVALGQVYGEAAASGTTEPLATWRKALLASGLVARRGARAPLILDDADRLFLLRYWDYEETVAREWRTRSQDPATGPDDHGRLTDVIRSVCQSGRGPGATAEQAAAVAIAAMHRIAVILGGPGTGKTTTAARVLATIAMMHAASGAGVPPRMALAAPTGKAAARLASAMAGTLASIDVPESIRAALPTSAATLHRLLGARAGSVEFRHGRGRPLPFDCVLVDEASMIDLALMARLLEALGPDTRLILLGDPDQLDAVEAGAVLSSLAAGPGVLTREVAAVVRAVAGADVANALPVSDDAPPGAAACARLMTSRRFAASGGIGQLAAAVRAGDAGTALALPREEALVSSAMAIPSTSSTASTPSTRSSTSTASTIAVSTPPGPPSAGAPVWARSAEVLRERVVCGMKPFLDALTQHAPQPGEVLAAFSRFRVLCAHREGREGVAGLNDLVERLVRDGQPGHSAWYRGRVVMVTRNDERLGLFNGDAGVVLPDASGRTRVWFERSDGTLAAFAPARLPEHETAFAMTVHKSQGSEFDEVMLVLPRKPSPLATRELVYTAITRARERLTLACEPEALRQAILSPRVREGALAERLWKAP